MTETNGAAHGGRFSTSGLPNYLEWYECYDDPAQEGYIDGMELVRNTEWDDRTRRKWLFFYRPVAVAVGRPQQALIHQELGRIAEAQREIKQSIAGVVGLLLLFVAVRLVGFECLWGLTTFLNVVGDLALGVYIATRGLAIRDARERVAALEGEIRELRRQIPPVPGSSEMEDLLRQEMRELEPKLLGEILGAGSDDPAIHEAVRAKLARHQDDLEHGLLVQGWGILQPKTIKGPAGAEGTGLETALKDLGGSAATWRPSASGRPICRFLYLQFIFPLDRNLNVYSMFYDFVTTKPYGRRADTFQYSLVTNFYVRQVEVGEGAWVRDVELPASFRGGFFDREIEAFALVNASGAMVRCVLTDAAVLQAMADWLKCSSNRRKLEGLLQEIRKQLAETRAPELCRRLEKQVQEITHQLATVEQLKVELEETDLHQARRALQCIRVAVEAAQIR